jgi:metal-responsive CopG/Arc/MetJ family transcriptional regulator
MFQPSVKFDKALWQRIQSCAASAGYSSPDEFVRDVLERELARLEDAGSKEEIIRKLKGLGYLE